MKKSLILLSVLLLSCSRFGTCVPKESDSDLNFKELSKTWDEAIPLGNAEIGELIWEKEGKLRLSLDHSDLWDLRPSSIITEQGNFSYKWVQERVNAGDLTSIDDKINIPYGYEAVPTKIPCAAIEFPIESFGKVSYSRLYLLDAVCITKWESGESLETFVNASEPVGWFIFRGLKNDDFVPQIDTPDYNTHIEKSVEGHSNIDLMALGYEQGEISSKENTILYHQKGSGDFSYDVAITWKRSNDTMYGTWSVCSSIKGGDAAKLAKDALNKGYKASRNQHARYWDSFWNASSVSLPDTILQHQYDMEMYKLGSASRENSRPISLQAIWTADNGLLPPWKGDYHNDLNTQLCYWPVYRGNHLSEGLAFLNTLWNQRETYRKYTSDFFGVNGIIVPGVMDLLGRPMGGWPQYSFSPTAGAWCAHHFYLHWKYSADNDFLRDRAYPFMKDVAVALDELSIKDSSGKRGLPLSTSPEIYECGEKAWFRTITNYDLALMRFTFGAAAEMASVLGLDDDAGRWSKCLGEMPQFDIDEDSSMTFAHGFPYNVSHRHLSHAMAIYPLGLLDVNDGIETEKIINSTIKNIDKYGPDYWCGYTYSWLGNMKARALDGDGAADNLRVFSKCFCLKNSFHVNGDQTATGKSLFTYRPFTLEGNFAFASAIQEMLIQSHTGIVRIFPALPSSWKDVSFSKLRTRGAFLVSARMEKGKVVSAEIFSEKGGKVDVNLPGDTTVLHFDTKPGQTIDLMN